MPYFHLSAPLRAAAFILAATATTVHGGSTHQARLKTRAYQTGGIQWQPCPDDVNAMATLDVECGTLDVPLDYTDPDSNKTLQLSLLKVPAVKKKAEHSILFNFGGPGFEARLSLAALGPVLHAMTGGEHDLIAWDPRGTGDTLSFSCFDNATARAEFDDLFVMANSSDVARGRLWAGGKIYADNCAGHPEAQERAPFISTSFTARDAMQIVDQVEADGLLRYYGFSYGTDLGAMLAALFPDRVEKLILDGVFNPTQYFYQINDPEGVASADDTFAEFFRQCVATPEVCALAQHHPNATAEQLESAAYDLIEELKYRPFSYGKNLIGYMEIKVIIRFALYSPRKWLNLDKALDVLLAEPRNKTLAGEYIINYFAETIAGTPLTNDAPFGINCVDKIPRTDNFEVINAAFDESQAGSRLLGDAIAGLHAICAQWTLEPRERYLGGFGGVKPRKPLLVIGNTYDSATSIISARNISETIEGSGFLEHGGVGHTTIQHPSLCTVFAIQDYFRNGTLPKPNTVCEPVTTPLKYAASGPTWQDLFPQLGFELPAHNGTGAAIAKRNYDVEDFLQKIGRPRSILW